MGVINYSFNLNILPKMSYSVLECDCYVTELDTYASVIKRAALAGVAVAQWIECWLVNQRVTG